MIIYLFRVVKEGLTQYSSNDLREMARKEIQGRHAQLLVKQPLNLTWGKKKVIDKYFILTKMLGFNLQWGVRGTNLVWGNTWIK